MGAVADKPIPETRGGFPAPQPISSPHFPIIPTQDFQANFKLIEAIKKCDIILLKKVLERYQINPTHLIGPSEQGKTILHKLAEHNFSEGMAHFLDELSSQKYGHASRIINMKDGDGNTPLLLCCLANAVETLEVLAHSEHIDIQVQNFAKKTALEIAMEMESSCVSILAALTAGSDPTTKATIKSSIEGSDQLQSLDQNDDANSDDNNTRTSLDCKSPTLPAAKAPKSVTEPQEISLEDVKDMLSQIIANLKANKTHFIDQEFPHELEYLESESEGTLMTKYPKLKWMRASNFPGLVPDTLTVFEHFEPNVAFKTPLVGCEIYSALAALAEFPQRLCKIFNTKDVSQHGIYSVTLNVSGTPIEMFLDDFFPSSDGDQFLYSRSISNELWFSLLEKAFAKLHGGYYGLDQIGVAEALETLTGMPVIHKPMKDPEHDKLWAKLMDYDKKNYIVCAGETKRHYNSFRNRIYTVIHVFEVENYKIIKLRNHFDDFSWEGDFSHKSELWTDKLKEEVGYCAADPTCFYMELKDFIAEFEFLTVCHYHDKWIHNRVNVNCQPNRATYFELKVENEMDAYISVHQKDPKFVDDGDYNYSPVEVILAKDLDGTALESIAFGERDAFIGKHAVYIHENHKVKLQPGRYIIYTKVRWVDNNMHDFFLNVLSSQFAQVDIISQPDNFDFLEQVYLNTGSLSNTKFTMANDCQFASGFSGSHLWMYASNKTNKTWYLEITFEKLVNLKLGKKYRDQPNTLLFVIPPNQKACAYAKRMNPGAVSVGWNFAQKWE